MATNIIFFIMLVMAFLSRDGCSMILSGVFNTASNSTQYLLERYDSQTLALPASYAQCALKCLRDRSELTPACGAFSCQPSQQELLCDFYAVGTMLSSPQDIPSLHMFEDKDVFHLISVEARLYSIYLSSVGKTYEEARSHCVSLGGYLLHFDSLDEYQAIRMILPALGPTDSILLRLSYIGANNKTNGNGWVSERDGTPYDPRFLKWGTNEPNGQERGEECVCLEQNMLTLHDITCGVKIRFICERDV